MPSCSNWDLGFNYSKCVDFFTLKKFLFWKFYDRHLVEMIIGQPQIPFKRISAFARDQKFNKLILHFNHLLKQLWWNGGRPIYFHRKSICAHTGSVIARNFSVKTQASVLGFSHLTIFFGFFTGSSNSWWNGGRYGRPIYWWTRHSDDTEHFPFCWCVFQKCNSGCAQTKRDH